MVPRLATALTAATLLVATASAGQFRPNRVPDAPFVPTPDSVVDAMLELAHVTSADVVYDLGSGDGRIPITAAKKYGAFGVGIEMDSLLIRRSNDNLKQAGVGDRVRFVYGDLFETDLSGASVVTMFLLPRVIDRLIPKFKRELRPGTRIVSHKFDMGETWPPEQSQDVNGLTIYLWTVK
ncbi:MAG: class I SAM-dependent methyltransferase [Acidobacteriia bacterium]|nr:class I SAM-dependent methyltransferase [Terriglobia bacterium]